MEPLFTFKLKSLSISNFPYDLNPFLILTATFGSLMLIGCCCCCRTNTFEGESLLIKDSLESCIEFFFKKI